MRPAVFIDRDDTLVDNRAVTASTPTPGDLFEPDLLRLLPGAGAACASLHAAGFTLVVITNQGAVARGHCTIEQVERTNEHLRRILHADAGVDLDAIYYCPYHPDGIVPEFAREHPDRKPAPGMILAAAGDLGLDLSRSWLVGDAPRDVEAGRAAGLDPARTLLIGDDDAAAFSDLAGAARHIMQQQMP